MRYLNLIFLCAVLIGCATSGGTGGTPRAAVSEYFTTKGGGFALRLDDARKVESCRYTVTLAPRRPVTNTLYLRTQFENPVDPGNPLIVDTEVKPGDTDVAISSPEVRGLRARRNYKVEILVFDAPDRMRPVGQHVQYVQSNFELK